MQNQEKRIFLFIGATITLLLLQLGPVLLLAGIRKSGHQQAYLNALQQLPYYDYLNTPYEHTLAAQTPEWDGYLFSSPELQCVRGGNFGVLVHKGTEIDKTVLWLQPGTECWPSHPLCGEPPDIANAAEIGLEMALSSANSSPFGPIQPDKKTQCPHGTIFMYQPAMGVSIWAIQSQIMTKMERPTTGIMDWARLRPLSA